MAKRTLRTIAEDLLACVLGNVAYSGATHYVAPTITAAMAVGGPTVAGAAPAVAAGIALAGFIGLSATKAWRQCESEQAQLAILNQLLSGTQLTKIELDELVGTYYQDSFTSQQEHDEIIRRIAAIGQVVSSYDEKASTLNNKLAGYDEAASQMKALLSDQTEVIAEFATFVDSRFHDLQETLDRFVGQDLLEALSRLFAKRPRLFRSTYTIDSADENANWFVYFYQYVDFVGRSEEQRRLWAFLRTPEDTALPQPFRWWVMTGKGGAGKSRLALHFCLSLRDTWYCGFLDQSQMLGEWQEWRPTRPTLIVVDYAAEIAEDLGKQMKSLFQQSVAWEYPVRVLLLERDEGTGWMERLLQTGSTQEELLKKCRHHDQGGASIVVGDMGDDPLWASVEGFFRKRHATPPNREQTLQTLRQIDRDGLPIYAALAAATIVSEGSIHGWDKARLTKALVDHNRKIWDKAGADEKYINLLALATMIGGVDWPADAETRVHIFHDDSLREYIPDDGGEFDSKLYRLICGQPLKSRLPPLEPDILGECFVLDHFDCRDSDDSVAATRQSRLLERFRNAAWRHNPLATAQFLNRIVMDFPRERSLVRLRQPPVGHDVYVRFLWSAVAVNMTYHYGSAGELGSARDVYEELRQLSQTHPDEAAVGEALSRAEANLRILRQL